ncbi:DNA methyltransferase, partial [Candidatus Albibeggiatoa sp. nov. BB20]|uniref:class I SAM-dependent DNA methyltransferase n=1 Tax=Candidatus Albibeggiatoa sp. nov. BB20 TaxID=3162723 RepID=UPI003365B1C2
VNRNKHLSDELAGFPYVNGQLFAERLDLPSFDAEMRAQLVKSAGFDWSTISPAIFGSLFQHIMGDSRDRRRLGAHYTSEKHILRLINPLFLDDLNEEFESLQVLKRDKHKKLTAFQKKLSGLYFFDPACGCGNFLIVTYQALRRLELQVLGERHKKTKDTHLNFEIEPLISLDHFYGIELEEWPMRIAEVAMWLTQHQMNREFAQQFGREPDLLPLKTSAQITCGNALQLDWQQVIDVSRFKQVEALYLLGNPPFIDRKNRTPQQRREMETLFQNIDNAGILDYVVCWFKKAADFMDITKNLKIESAFVSTNSIIMGEQVYPAWQHLLDSDFYITFAHQTFAWDSESKGKAIVYVVIVGFAKGSKASNCKPCLFTYPQVKDEPLEIKVKHLNPYLIAAPDILIRTRAKPISEKSSVMKEGITPLDNGHLILSTEEKQELIQKEPSAEKWLYPWVNGQNFLHNKEQWCLWLSDISPKELKSLKLVMLRVEKVKQYRASSQSSHTRSFANRPWTFREMNFPKEFIIFPKTSSERREYLPIGFIKDAIASNATLVLPNATLYEFGILESKLHTLWLKTIGGRLKSDYRYSAKLVYNNYPFPQPTPKQKQAIETAAQAVLDCREEHPDNSLADLYDPLAMPTDLRKAHQTLDNAVEKAYRSTKFKTDQARISFLFQKYLELTDPEKAQECLDLWEEDEKN